MKNFNTKTLTISIPSNFYAGLEKLALQQDRSKNYLIRKAIENYLEDLYFSKKAEEVLARNEPTITLDEIARKYDYLPNKIHPVSKKRPAKAGKKPAKKNLRVAKK